PDYTPIYGLLGQLDVRAGHFSDGASYLEKALQGGIPSTQAAESQYWWGKALMGEGQLEDAQLHFQEALKINPDDPDFQEALQESENPAVAAGAAEVHRGMELAQAGQMDQAIAVWTAATQKFPKLAAAYGNLGVAYFQRGDYPTAIREFNLALAANPNAPQAEVFLGTALAAEGKKADAIEAFNRALVLSPGDPDAENALKQLQGH
ncbi:MAG: tetratricopeptide repeat protein, partial [Capsulimonadaceae bacterium]